MINIFVYPNQFSLYGMFAFTSIQIFCEKKTYCQFWKQLPQRLLNIERTCNKNIFCKKQSTLKIHFVVSTQFEILPYLRVWERFRSFKIDSIMVRDEKNYFKHGEWICRGMIVNGDGICCSQCTVYQLTPWLTCTYWLLSSCL